METCYSGVYSQTVASRSIRVDPGLEEIKSELQAILSSDVFSHSARQAKLLEYVCNKALLGEVEHLKATTIAIDVFGRSCDFDESKDAIVRVEAHRLRRKLARYYEGTGAASKIRITLPPGGYVPEFVLREPDANPASTLAAPDAQNSQPVSVAEDPIREAEGPGELARPVRQSRVLLVGVAGLLVAVLAGSILVSRGGGAFVKSLAAQPAHGVRVPVSFASGPEIRILAGQTTASYVDRWGSRWGPDRYFTGGAAEPGPKDFYGRPPDAGLFERMRSGEFSYDIPVPSGEYELRLYWAEPIFRLATESNGGGENERRFHVSVNGQRLLTAFDVVADSGTSPVDIRAFRGITPDRDGMVHIRFAAAYGTPFVNGIELLPTAHGRTVPIRIRAHELSFTDHDGNIWTPDNYYVGGRLATHKEPVTGTEDPELFAGERYGNFSYAIPEPDGTYAVTLYFAETWFHPDTDGEDMGGAGNRIFDVYCNGTTLLKDLDIFARVGPFHAMPRTYRGIRPNGQGKIMLTFSPARNYATVKAIQVVDEP